MMWRCSHCGTLVKPDDAKVGFVYKGSNPGIWVFCSGGCVEAFHESHDQEGQLQVAEWVGGPQEQDRKA